MKTDTVQNFTLVLVYLSQMDNAHKVFDTIPQWQLSKCCSFPALSRASHVIEASPLFRSFTLVLNYLSQVNAHKVFDTIPQWQLSKCSSVPCIVTCLSRDRSMTTVRSFTLGSVYLSQMGKCTQSVRYNSPMATLKMLFFPPPCHVLLT